MTSFPSSTLIFTCIVFTSIVACSFSLAQIDAPSQTDGKIKKTSSQASPLPLEDLQVFTRAYEYIRTTYVKEIDDRTLLEYAIRGMLGELDPHSNYLDSSSFDDLQVHTKGEFGGLGIEVGMEDGFIRIIAPIDDTPAARGGIKAGDLIIKLDSESVKGLSIDEAVEKMRGPKGSEISLMIVRDGIEQPFEIILKRDTIKVKSVRSKVIDNAYGYVRIAQFQMNTGQEVNNEIKRLKKSAGTLQGLILDLRNNPGGVLQSSVDVVDLFIQEGLIVYTEGRLDDSNVKFKAKKGDVLNGLPIVVLINSGSASASEIVAGALQDQKRALIIGTRSFGKGSVQSVINLTDDRAIKLTTALYYTPNGRSIQAEGIIPDIKVKPVRVTELKQQFGMTEVELKGHIENTKTNNKKNKKSKKQKNNDSNQQLHDQDSQLYEALNVLKGISLFNQLLPK